MVTRARIASALTLAALTAQACNSILGIEEAAPMPVDSSAGDGALAKDASSGGSAGSGETSEAAHDHTGTGGSTSRCGPTSSDCTNCMQSTCTDYLEGCMRTPKCRNELNIYRRCVLSAQCANTADGVGACEQRFRENGNDLGQEATQLADCAFTPRCCMAQDFTCAYYCACMPINCSSETWNGTPCFEYCMTQALDRNCQAEHCSYYFINRNPDHCDHAVLRADPLGGNPCLPQDAGGG